jgi:hypothetical protein
MITCGDEVMAIPARLFEDFQDNFRLLLALGFLVPRPSAFSGHESSVMIIGPLVPRFLPFTLIA